jgi:hypothetical protein
VFHAATQHDVLVDDAWIFHRYANNWAAGLGPVFNAGERVEGYSSLLWTALLALGARCSWRPESLAPLLGLLFGGLTLILTAALTRRLVPQSSSLAVAVPLAVSLSTGLAYFAVAGMDTPLFACVLLTTALSAMAWLDGGRRSALLLALGALVIVRAEGAAYVCAVLVVLGIVVVRSGNVRLRSDYRGVIGWTLLVLLVQFGGRRLYYGEWFPTPALSKAFLEHAILETRRLHLPYSALVIPTIRHGFDYQRHVLIGLAVPFAVLAVASARGARGLHMAWMAASLTAVNALLIVLAAGDWMPYQRLGIAVWPLVLLLAAWACLQIAAWCGVSLRWAQVLGIVAVVVIGVCRFETPSLEPDMQGLLAPREQGGSLLYRQLGELVSRSEPAVTLVTNIAGKMPYYAGPRTRVVDLMGLTDRWNAEHGDYWSLWFGRTDYATTFSRPFDLFVTSSPVDLAELAAARSLQPAETPDLWFFPARSWLDASLFVAADPRHPIALALISLCRCTPERLTVDLVRRYGSSGGALR